MSTRSKPLPTGQRASQRAGDGSYKDDYYTWANSQARALREQRMEDIDWNNLAEEVEDLGRNERHRLESHLELLLLHLLKWAYQPERRTRGWRDSIEEHRFRVQKVLRVNPGLKSDIPAVTADAYQGARFGARKETGLELSTFPESCPWHFDEIMKVDFLPEEEPREDADISFKR